MKEILSLILVIFLVGLVEGYQLGVAPPEVVLESGECREIYVFSNDYTGNIEVRDKWSRERSTNLGDYNLNAEDIGLDVRYFKNFELNGMDKTKICIYGAASYYGILFFKTEEGNVEIGSRVVFNGGNKEGEIGKSLIEGRVISDTFGFFDEFGVKEGMVLSSLCVSLALLGLLFFILRQERAKKSS